MTTLQDRDDFLAALAMAEAKADRAARFGLSGDERREVARLVSNIIRALGLRLRKGA